MNTLRGWTIRTRLIACTALLLGLLALTSLGGFFGLRHVSQAYAALTEHEGDVLSLISDLRSGMGQLRRHEKDLFINLDNEESMAKYEKQWLDDRQVVEASIRTLAEVLSAGDREQLLAGYGANMQAYFDTAVPVLKRARSGGLDSPMAANRLMERAKVPFHNAEKQLADWMKKTNVALADGKGHLADMAGTMTKAALGVLALGLAAGSAAAWLMIRSITQPLTEAVRVAEQVADGDLRAAVNTDGHDEITALMRSMDRMRGSLTDTVSRLRQTSDQIGLASAEVAQGNADLSTRTEQAAGSLQQTASSMEQFTVTVRQSAASAGQAKELAVSAAVVAQRGGSVVAQVVTTMQDINNSSRRIADIVGTIDGIAFQTNILALNAAVEAARAGEQGRGFAVVASEVRSLAQRSAEAAREIKSLIGASVERVEAGSQLVASAGSTMNEIVASVQRVSDIVGEISNAAAEQSSGIGQVNSAVNDLDRMTQQNAALVEESAAAAESLKEQAGALTALVSTFKLQAA